jgi:hypothetical protein
LLVIVNTSEVRLMDAIYMTYCTPSISLIR